MPDRHKDDALAEMLQQGLRDLPVPALSADFDARVRAGLRQPQPTWAPFLAAMRLTLAPAACALAVTLAALIAVGVPSAEPERAQRRSGGSVALDRYGDRLRTIEQQIEQLDGATPSIGGFSAGRGAASREKAPRTPAPDAHGAFRRRTRAGSRAQA